MFRLTPDYRRSEVLLHIPVMQLYGQVTLTVDGQRQGAEQTNGLAFRLIVIKL